MKDVFRKTRFTGSGCQAAPFVAK